MIEADFQREYGMNLMTAIDSMTQRRFFNLLFGLSPDSWFWQINRKQKKEINDPEMAEKQLLRMFKSVDN